jgi:GNAT superfamily N-acetyltransferase
MTSDDVTVRIGCAADAPAVLGFFDRAIAWLVERGRTGQWGSAPFSSEPRQVERVHGWAGSGGLRIAEIDGTPVGAMVLGTAPPYVHPAREPELYLLVFITDRRYAGRGVGRVLLDRAAVEAVGGGTPLLRVDCWAGGDGELVRYYEGAGFTPTERFTVGDWEGQVLIRRCDEP